MGNGPLHSLIRYGGHDRKSKPKCVRRLLDVQHGCVGRFLSEEGGPYVEVRNKRHITLLLEPENAVYPIALGLTDADKDLSIRLGIWGKARLLAVFLEEQGRDRTANSLGGKNELFPKRAEICHKGLPARRTRR